MAINMKKRFVSLKKNENGQSVLELALTLPILILVLCAIIDFGWIFSNKLMIIYSCREGARYGVVNAKSADAINLIRQKTIDATPEFVRNNIIVTVNFSDTLNPKNGDVKVSINCNVKPLTPLIGIFVRDEYISLTSDCIMKVEQ